MKRIAATTISVSRRQWCNTRKGNYIMKYVELKRYEELLGVARTVTWCAFLTGFGIGVTVAALIIGRMF